MKTPFHGPSATCIAALATAISVTSAAGQVASKPHTRAALSSMHSEPNFPSPINLKVLPKSLSGRQVHDVMEQWSGELGVRCSACHVTDLEGVVRGGMAQPRFADDAKPMKGIARIMYTMTLESNRKFITGDGAVPGPVTCGMCHRGSLRPQPFVVPPKAQELEMPAGVADRAAISR